MNQLNRFLGVALLLTVSFVVSRQQLDGAERPSKVGPAKQTRIPGLVNTYQLTDKIYSGSQPDTDEAFAALKKLGIKTIISVDGSKPDVAGAHKFGLHYVHLPIGYDGVPTNRLAELSKVTTVEPGPFYVHCHHGLHRGPTGAAVICEATAGWTPDEAVAWLHEVGTSPDYPGLFRSAREFKMPTRAELNAATNFPEIAHTSSLVDTMVAIDDHFSWIKQSQKAGWKTPPNNPDIAPDHEATMLWELFREIPRATDLKGRTTDFREKLAHAEASADQLRTVLKERADNIKLDAAFEQTSQSCSACHEDYRNK